MTISAYRVSGIWNLLTVRRVLWCNGRLLRSWTADVLFCLHETTRGRKLFGMQHRTIECVVRMVSSLSRADAVTYIASLTAAVSVARRLLVRRPRQPAKFPRRLSGHWKN